MSLRNDSSLALLLGLCCSTVAAHDFWLQPGEYWTQPGVTTPLTLQVGHGPLRQRSPIPLRRIMRFETIAVDGTTANLRANLHPGESAEDGILSFQAPGTYVVVLETDDKAQSHLPAIRFNDYLRVEGLTAALEDRARVHRMNADGSESYRRVTKSIVQVGKADSNSQARVDKPVGLQLEIVPERSPYVEPRATTLPVRVIYEGRPLVGALVKMTDLENDASPFETHLTDRSGRASFTMPGRGKWMLNVIWTKRLPAESETDYETVFSSLSFGFK